MALQHEVEQWLFREAALLDRMDFDGWLELFTDDAVYEMPLRTNVVGLGQPDVSYDFLIFDDDRQTLQMRVDRLKSEFAWAEIPPSRTRRFVTNVRIVSVSGSGEMEVHSSLLLYRSRGSEAEADLISGERRDVFRREGESLKLAKRSFLIDQTSVNTRNFAVFV
ncbi:MAG: aromatic-ring-hydroxylating dioxygenase subunit beta [Alicyclobacillus sp.]|nr:aromatic-ring-hydroxylating dioxygenase subunit beta [Alicyclobacillus sp.]